MGNLFGSLLNTSGTLRAYERQLATIQNNVSNASTPGFARQRQILEAKRFDLPSGIAGGVDPGIVANYRNQFLEAAVQRRQEDFSKADQTARDLVQIESEFPVGENAGIPGALDRVFQSFSGLTVSPNDLPSREVALGRAREAAEAFNQTARTLDEASGQASRELLASVQRINEITARVAEINTARRDSFTAAQDPGLDTTIYQQLEELSTIINIRAVSQPDGQISVFAGSGRPLVLSDRTYPPRLAAEGARLIIVDSDGEDLTGSITGGRLASLLETFNERIPGYQADLNQLAAAFADEVNTILDGGVDLNGNAPPRERLFTYGATNAARTLTVNNLTGADLALATPESPRGNAKAVELAQLAIKVQPNGYTLQSKYGEVAGRIGRELATARERASFSEQLLDQSRSIRQDEQGVSLDEEAAQLIQAQRAYQAAAQFFKVLNELTQSIVNLAS
jgi:flagellar hook-associated protein 1 FlgK